MQISHSDVNCEDLVLGLPLASCRRYPFTYLGEDKHKVQQGLTPCLQIRVGVILKTLGLHAFTGILKLNIDVKWYEKMLFLTHQESFTCNINI